MLEPKEEDHPVILELPQKYHFGKLYREFYEIWIELHQQTGVEFDLLYDPPGWLTLMAYRERLGRNVMYIHQGGLLGNDSMLPRYQRKYSL
jgi:1-aminocyclopropane-1-carboxylate deaminase/D-cysteine desulfhydrase-like pyridoxal-dependent ACC family enzyme